MPSSTAFFSHKAAKSSYGWHQSVICESNLSDDGTETGCEGKGRGLRPDALYDDEVDEEEMKTLIDKLPNINGVVHCAGVTAHTPAQFIRPSKISQIFDINYTAPVLLMAGILRKKKMLEQGSILFLSSIASKRPYFGGSVYSSSKAAIEAYSKTLAVELGSKKIRSNCISPSFVQTEMVEQAKDVISDEKFKLMESTTPLGFGVPHDVLGAISFFMSDASKWVTGTNLALGVID